MESVVTEQMLGKVVESVLRTEIHERFWSKDELKIELADYIAEELSEKVDLRTREIWEMLSIVTISFDDYRDCDEPFKVNQVEMFNDCVFGVRIAFVNKDRKFCIVEKGISYIEDNDGRFMITGVSSNKY